MKNEAILVNVQVIKVERPEVLFYLSILFYFTLLVLNYLSQQLLLCGQIFLDGVI